LERAFTSKIRTARIDGVVFAKTYGSWHYTAKSLAVQIAQDGFVSTTLILMPARKNGSACNSGNCWGMQAVTLKFGLIRYSSALVYSETGMMVLMEGVPPFKGIVMRLRERNFVDF